MQGAVGSAHMEQLIYMGSFEKSVYGPKNSAAIPSPVTARETRTVRAYGFPCCPFKANGTITHT